MSNLLNKLSKLNRTPGKGEVPPDIREKVLRADETRRSKHRYLLCVVVSICAVLLGFGARSYLNKAPGPLLTDSKTTFPQTVPVAPQMIISSARKTPIAVDTAQSATIASSLPVQTASSTLKTEQHMAAPARAKKSPLPGRMALSSMTAKRNEARSASLNTVVKANDAAAAVSAPQAQPIDKEARDAILTSAKSAEKRKSYNEALRLYQKALSYDQDNYCLMNNTASMYIRLGEYPAGLSMSDKALLLAPDYIPALINQGIARNALGNPIEAAESFAKAVRLDPANKTALYNLALFNEKNGKLDAAAQAYLRLAKVSDVQGMIGLARIYEKQSRRSDAVKIYVEIAAMPDVPTDARNTVVRRLRQLGD